MNKQNKEFNTSIKDVKNIDHLMKLAMDIKKDPFGFKTYGKNKTLGLLFLNPSLRLSLIIGCLISSILLTFSYSEYFNAYPSVNGFITDTKTYLFIAAAIKKPSFSL